MPWMTRVTTDRDLLTLREVADRLSIDPNQLSVLGRALKIPYWQALVPRDLVDEALRAGNAKERLRAIRGPIIRACHASRATTED